MVKIRDALDCYFVEIIFYGNGERPPVRFQGVTVCNYFAVCFYNVEISFFSDRTVLLSLLRRLL